MKNLIKMEKRSYLIILIILFCICYLGKANPKYIPIQEITQGVFVDSIGQRTNPKYLKKETSKKIGWKIKFKIRLYMLILKNKLKREKKKTRIKANRSISNSHYLTLQINQIKIV